MEIMQRMAPEHDFWSLPWMEDHGIRDQTLLDFTKIGSVSDSF